MCAVSFVGDSWKPKLDPWIYPGTGIGTPLPGVLPTYEPPVSRQEFEALKNLVLEMKKELVEARKQDIANNEPDCEMEEKVAILKKVAEMVGISLEEVFPQHK